MRDWRSLASDIIELQSIPCVWPDDLLPVDQNKFLKYTQDAFSWFLTLLSKSTQGLLSDDETERRLRLFLKLFPVAGSSIDCTFNPHSALSSAYLKIAIAVAKENESICEILMPGLTGIIGSGYREDDLKNNSEDKDGQFLLQNFLRHSNLKELIDVLTVLNRARFNTDLLFPVLKNSAPSVLPAQPFNLTARDRQRIRDFAGKASQEYFDALKQIHDARHGQKPCLDRALRELQVGTKKSSKKNTGSEFLADANEYEDPLVTFYNDVWSKLNKEVKDKIRCFKANAATVTLETLLISMFVNSGSINFTDAEYTKMLEDKDKPGFIECTDDFEQQFTSLINDNPEFLNIPLPGKEEEFKNWRETADSKALDDLEKNFQAALMSRPALLGYNDPECIIGHFCFEIMVKDFFDQALLEKNIVALAETVKNIEEFTCALMMLEKRHWKLFLTQLNATLAKIFPPDSETKSVFYFFFHFPEENWTTFFETLKKLGRNRLLNTYQLGSLLNVLPESKWTVLNEAVYPLLHHLFFSFKDVALFFSAVPLVGWAKSVGLFREQIEKVLKKELNFISILFILPHDNWPFFCEIFKKALSEALQEGDQLENFFFQINYDYKFAFFESILPVFIDLPPGFLARAFKLLSKDAWTDAFLLFKEEQFKALSKDIVSMTDFLNDFEKNDRVHILKCLLVYKEKISIEFNVVKQLAIKFPECKDELLFSIESQLPKIISDALFILANYDFNSLPEPKDFSDDLNFIVKHVFPLRLDYSLSETVEPAILVDLQSFESMQFAFSFLDASNRFYFFAFFSQNIVILSLRDVSLLLQSLEQSFWKDAIDLLELEKLNLVLQNESDLRNLLNHFEKTDRIACLNALHIIFPLFEINASSFCFLLKEFPECESALPCIFIKNIPGMFLKMFAEFLGFDKDDFPISECLKNEFNFIVEKTLPFLLRSQSIMLFCPSFLRASNQRHSFLLGDEAVYNFYKEIKMIESTFFNDAISLLSAIKKLQILKNFMIETKEKRIPETTFYAELVKNFGENFFVPLDDYIKRFQAESFVSVVSSVSFVRRAAAAIAPERAHHERMPSL